MDSERNDLQSYLYNSINPFNALTWLSLVLDVGSNLIGRVD